MSTTWNSVLARRRWLAVAAIVILLGGGAYIWHLRKNAGAAEYITEPVERGSIRNVVNATGTVQAVLTVQVGSQVSGQLESLYADFNSVVKRGQVLARLDARRYQAAVAQAQANLQAAQARVNTAEAELISTIASRASSQANAEAARVARDNSAQILARFEKLKADGILSQNDYDTAKSNADSAAAKYTQAQAQLDQAEAQINSSKAQVEQSKAQVQQTQGSLRQAQIDLEYTTISSPVDGVVVSRNVDVGQTVAASLSAPTLFIIANDLAKMQVNASVDEADIGSISDAEAVQFTVDAYPNRNFTGRISEIRLEPSSVQNVTTYSVIINVDNERLELKPGMTANITVTVERQDDVMKISNAAMRYLPQGATRDQVEEMIQKAGPARVGEEPFSTALPAKMKISPEPAAKADTAAPGSNQMEAGESRQGAAAGARPGHGGMPERGAVGFERDRRQGQAGVGTLPSTGDPSAVAGLAPGQMWNPQEKIQFPHQGQRSSRVGIVWVLGADNKPEPRHVVLGITDGRQTQVVSGELKETDAVIIGDSSQAATTQSQQNRSQTGVGGPPGGGGGGGRRFFFGGGH